jgi:hypothetical protein
MAQHTRLDFRHYINGDQLVIPKAVEGKMAQLHLRLKDVLWTFNFPIQERREAEGKYKRKRWFGEYWVGLLCKCSQDEQRWVVLTCWKEATLA